MQNVYIPHNNTKHIYIPEQSWYSGSCLTVVTSTHSGSRQLHSEPIFSPKHHT